MSHLKRGCWGLFTALLLFAPTATALELQSEHHPWGRFPQGSWARLRRTTYVPTAEGGEKVDQVVTRTVRLEKVGDSGYTLSVEETVDGKAAEPVATDYGWDGLPVADERHVRLSVGEIKVEGKSYTCQTHETTIDKPGDKTAVKWWYCPDQPPFLLKRVLRSSGNQPRFLLEEAKRFGVPRDVLGKEHACTAFRIEENTNARNTLTNAYTSVDVPGGLVFSETQVRDRERGQVQRMEESIEAFEIAAAQARP